MILDAYLKVASAQAQTGSNEVSASAIDLGAATVARRIGTGEPIAAIWIITTVAAGDSGSATDTCDFAIVQDTASTLASATVIAQRRVAASALTVGAVIVLGVPPGTPTARYIGTKVLLGTGDTLSADAYIVPQHVEQQFTAYAKNYVV